MLQEAEIEHSLRTAPKSSFGKPKQQKEWFGSACVVAQCDSTVRHAEGLPCNRTARPSAPKPCHRQRLSSVRRIREPIPAFERTFSFHRDR
jgi:hypothetical protein